MKHFNGLFVSAAAVAIVLSSFVGIAQAGIALNGISPNRVTANGVAANRVAAKQDKAARNRISVDPQVEVVGVKLSKN